MSDKCPECGAPAEQTMRHDELGLPYVQMRYVPEQESPEIVGPGRMRYRPVCQADRDGECGWAGCPQKQLYRNYCPLAAADDAYYKAIGDDV